ncbi:uncharacterized protein EAF02_001639 [Botrytis sinoallii]|uniref:uncharacterized protein n=1 Tax=Botrytis sinoallii TaxID=1463999 RepID=UPI00190266C7|nr:uncharacterized protein EAF02_001639 [Botrytis sinoallii]KAF7891314.1 hypothetical protein EAF02_001639 [Botrytis sinoallii]
MGRFNFIESECFWNQIPEEISTITFNVGKLNNVDPKPHKDNEDYKNQIAHEHFSYEYSRGLTQDPYRLVGMNFFFESCQGAKFSKHCPDDWYNVWGEWLRDGGLTWLKDGGPKPVGIQYDNPTAYDLDRHDYYVEPWMEEEFINRGVPNIGTSSEFWVPGVPEVRYMKLEIHG